MNEAAGFNNLPDNIAIKILQHFTAKELLILCR